jgi:di/tripeptidase
LTVTNPSSSAGVAVYRFGASLYYANTSRFTEELATLAEDADPPLKWIVVDAEAISDDDTLTFQGNNTHPGYAKGKMINSIKVAADFINRLPKDRLSPETTEGYDGFVHPYVVQASVERTSVKLLIRDFETTALAEREARLEALAKKLETK